MSFHTDTYKQIRERIIKTWPLWKKKVYNSGFAVSAHAEKLPEEYLASSTPVWTHYDRMMQMSPEELAKELFHFCPHEEDGCRHLTDNTPCVACRIEWLESPVEE